MQCRGPGFDPWVGKIPWRRERLPTAVFWPGEFHGPYSPWGRKKLEMTVIFTLRRLAEVMTNGSSFSVTKSHLTLCITVGCGIPGSSVLHYLLEFAQTHVHWLAAAIQPSCPLLPPSPFAYKLFQCQGLFQWISSLHHMGKAWELQLQQQSFGWILRVNFL